MAPAADFLGDLLAAPAAGLDLAAQFVMRGALFQHRRAGRLDGTAAVFLRRAGSAEVFQFSLRRLGLAQRALCLGQVLLPAAQRHLDRLQPTGEVRRVGLGPAGGTQGVAGGLLGGLAGAAGLGLGALRFAEGRLGGVMRRAAFCGGGFGLGLCGA